MKNFTFGVVSLLVLMLAVACTIDVSGGGTSSSADGGSAVTDGGTQLPPEDIECEVVYTAPVNASVVAFHSNFTGRWVNGDPVLGRTVWWSGKLDPRRLDLPACTALAVNQECGYICNASFPPPPHWAATQSGVVGELSVSCPVPVEAVWVENGLDGANLHLRRVR